MRPTINNLKSTQFMHRIPAFDTVLHVGHHEWHGIRNCISYNPGNKLFISERESLSHAQVHEILDWINDNGISRVVFHGYSTAADDLLVNLKTRAGSGVDCYFVSHVTTSQFDNYFEIEMQARVLSRYKLGLFRALASVKPNFSETFAAYWPKVLLNFPPNLATEFFPARGTSASVFAPLDPGWRKNLYTNVAAALAAGNVDEVKTANFPSGLENIIDISKLRTVGYVRGRELFAEMARSNLVLICSFAECQPMTQLEAFAVGTLALTGNLYLDDFAGDPLIQLCSTDKLDNPGLLRRKIEELVDLSSTSCGEMRDLVSRHLDRRIQLASLRYSEFLEL